IGADPPGQIPLLSYDESAGLWRKEGDANLVNGAYVATVHHFSTFNTDLLKTEPACIRIDATLMPSQFFLQLTVPTSGGHARTPTVFVDNTKSRFHALYNLPLNTDIQLRAFTPDPFPSPIKFLRLPPDPDQTHSVDHVSVDSGG